jgi:SLT domain-containing protein
VPDLPRVTQEFDADVTPYIEHLQLAIEWAEQFTAANQEAIDSVNELHAALDALPELKDITVRVRYETIGKPDDIKAATQIIRQVVIPAGDTISGGTQAIRQVVTPGEGFAGGFGDVAEQVTAIKAETGALRDNAAAMTVAANATRDNAGATGLAIGYWRAGWGWLGLLRGNVALFGGALSGVPLLASVSGLHLLVDGIAEVAAVIIPAAIAFAAFGAAAIPTINDIVDREKALYTVSQALGVQMPGLSGGFQKIADSVQPNVYILFGEALNTINQHTSLFATLAKGAGVVLDELGARAELALGGSGLHGLIAKGVNDLQILGNIIGNVFGILGNVLRNLPGYAEKLFTALQDVTGALEAVTGSSVVQRIIEIGLALHGAALYGGLAATALLALQGPITGLAKWLWGAVISLDAYVLNIIAAEGATATFEAIVAPLAAINPFVWAAVAVGALTALVVWLANTKTAAQQAFASIEQNINQATTFTQAEQALAQGIAQTNQQLASTPKYVKEVTGGFHGIGDVVTVLNPQYKELTDNARNLGTQQSTLSVRMQELNRITGSSANTLADLNAINVTAGQVATESGHAFVMQRTEIQALQAAEVQLAGYTGGPALAAQNALTNEFMNEQLPAIQKVTTAENDLMKMVLGGEQAFVQFQLGINAASSDAKVAGTSLGGLNQQSLTLANDVYNSLVPGLENTAIAMKQQNATTGDLTTVLATGAKQVLAYGSNNTLLKTTMVSMINDALGPGTVSLQTVNKWVNTNSTSLQGMQAAIAETTVKASALANVLNSQVNTAMTQSIIDAFGGQRAFDQFAQGVLNSHNRNQAWLTSAQDVINILLRQSSNNIPAARNAFDLYAQSMGLSKNQADALFNQLTGKTIPSVNALSKAINNVPKLSNIVIHETGQGQWSVSGSTSQTGVAHGPQNIGAAPGGAAAGMRVPGWGGGDSFPAMLEPGEAVVPKHLVSAIAPFLGAHKVPGFAGGGYVDSFAGSIAPGLSAFTINENSKFINSLTGAMESAMTAAIKAAQAAAAATGGISQQVSGHAGYAAFVAAAIQAIRLTGVPMSWLPDLSLIALYESGYNPNAINLNDVNAQHGDPSRGLMQTIMSTFLANHVAGTSYNIYDPVANIAAAIEYILRTYGSVFNVPGVVSVNRGGGYVGYDDGGWLMPGLTMAVNNTGRPERVVSPGQDGGTIEANITIHNEINGKALWTTMQQETLKYNMRNSGRPVGTLVPGR